MNTPHLIQDYLDQLGAIEVYFSAGNCTLCLIKSNQMNGYIETDSYIETNIGSVGSENHEIPNTCYIKLFHSEHDERLEEIAILDGQKQILFYMTNPTLTVIFKGLVNRIK